MTEQQLQEIEALGRDGYRATWTTIDELVAAVRTLMVERDEWREATVRERIKASVREMREEQQ